MACWSPVSTASARQWSMWSFSRGGGFGLRCSAFTRLCIGHSDLTCDMSSNELAQKIGITTANLSILKTNKGKAIRFSTLDKICEVLECTPGDILEYKKMD